MEKLQPIILRPNFASESERLEFLQRLINQKDVKNIKKIIFIQKLEKN
jgi:hypothetical protein